MKLDLGQEVGMDKTNTMVVLQSQLADDMITYEIYPHIFRYFDNLFTSFYLRLRTSLIDNI